MLTILLHSSKTMRASTDSSAPYQAPALIARARELAEYLRMLSPEQLATSMKLSPAKATATRALLAQWCDDPVQQAPAIDAFLGDIYSGLQVADLTADDRTYANDHLIILSGLYGGLRACDSIMPYRLEMGCRLPSERYGNLYRFWGDAIAGIVPVATDTIINLSAVEYTKALLPFCAQPVVTPKFLTVHPRTARPTFVTVHAKIARGAFARWLITQRINSIDKLPGFAELNYQYSPSLSTPSEPIFVCQSFGGLGLSIRKR